MDIEYSSDKVREQCTDMKAASKLFGGNKPMAVSLMARLNAIRAADSIKDIIVQRAFHFHSLTNNGKKDLSGYYAIDVKSRKEPWRIILQMLGDDSEPYIDKGIDEIAGQVKIVRVEEVSNHYE